MKKQKPKTRSKSTGKVRISKAVEAPNLRVRTSLMRHIADLVKHYEWTQAEAADRCGVSQPRMNDLLRGRRNRFSLDALVNIAAALGRKVIVDVER
jgi:predicted XRE-type DNA-binding protein